MEDEVLEEETVTEDLPFGPGDRLRRAREEKGWSLDHVAAQTRISSRQLESIEAENFAELPGRTYALGFSRTYAKLLDLDAEEIVAQVREELNALEPEEDVRLNTFEPGDPARVPSNGLVWLSLAAVVLLIAGIYAAYQSFFSPAVDLPPQVAEVEEGEAGAGEAGGNGAAAPAANPEGAVVFTALEEGIWVKFYDASGSQLMQKQMAQGERYTVPADAQGPQIWTGRPDALAITIGGKSVPKLADEDQIMKDVPVTAQALIERGQAAAGATPTTASDAG